MTSVNYSIFEEAKQIISTEEVARQAGVKLKQAGTRLVGCCPLHSEKSGSFIIYSDGSWHCFGCQINGRDVVDLFAKLKGISLINAARQLAGNPTGEYTRPAINTDRLERLSKADEITLLIGLSNNTKKYMGSYDPDDAFDHPFFAQLVCAVGIMDAKIEVLENELDEKRKRHTDGKNA